MATTLENTLIRFNDGTTQSTAATTPPAASTTVAGIVQLSTATNSTSTTLAATPSAVKAAYDAAMSDAAVSKAANGYVKLRSGLIIQWATISLGGNSGTGRWAIAFPTACASAVTSGTYAGWSGTNQHAGVTGTATGFTAYRGGDGPGTLKIIAVGY